jgi:hypothetical protein
MRCGGGLIAALGGLSPWWVGEAVFAVCEVCFGDARGMWVKLFGGEGVG